MNTKEEFRAWFTKVLAKYRNNELEHTYYNPSLDGEYVELINLLVDSGDLKVITPSNKFYIVGTLDAYTHNRKHDSKESCLDIALLTMLDKGYYDHD